MKKISSGTLNQKLNRETTNATDDAKQQDQHDRRERDDHRVPEVQRDLPVRPGVAVVREAERVRERDVAVRRRVRVRAGTR